MTSLGCELGSGGGVQGVERGKGPRVVLSCMERLVAFSHRGRGQAFWEDGPALAGMDGVCGRRVA